MMQIFSLLASLIKRMPKYSHIGDYTISCAAGGSLFLGFFGWDGTAIGAIIGGLIGFYLGIKKTKNDRAIKNSKRTGSK